MTTMKKIITMRIFLLALLVIAIMVISPDGTTFSGVKSEQVEMQLQTTETAN